MDMQTVFKYADLSDAAKARAVQWYREAESRYWEPMVDDLDDYVESLEMLGFNVDTETYRGASGKTHMRHAIDYSIGFCQSDYACFTGGWDARNLDLAELQAERPTDETLEYIGAQLMAIVLRWPQSHCRFKGGEHVPRMEWAYSDRDTEGDTITDENAAADEEFEDAIREQIKALFQWLYESLSDEYEYATSEEAAIESIEANEYDFDEEGNRV